MSGGGGGEGEGLERMPELSYVARATPDDIELVDDFRRQVFHLEAELRDQREAVRVRRSENSRTDARGGGGAASAAEHVGSACASQGGRRIAPTAQRSRSASTGSPSGSWWSR